MELTRENFRALIYYNFRRRLLKQEYIDQLISTCGDKFPFYATVKRWYNEFNRGRHSLTDQFHKDRPKSVVGTENINAVQILIMQDHYVTYREIEATLGISATSIYKILHEHLAAKKICFHWHTEFGPELAAKCIPELSFQQRHDISNRSSVNILPMLSQCWDVSNFALGLPHSYLLRFENR